MPSSVRTTVFLDIIPPPLTHHISSPGNTRRMSLKPVLKVKVDELFLLWLADPDTQTLLKSNLTELIRGEPITRPPPLLATSKSGGSSRIKQAQSPRLRPSSPSAPPCSPSAASPRSPRPRVGSFKVGYCCWHLHIYVYLVNYHIHQRLTSQECHSYGPSLPHLGFVGRLPDVKLLHLSLNYYNMINL